MNKLTLGSLFDGSGGFPLGGCLAGIEPRWASEIEPFPLRVTIRRFPGMKHLGNIKNINGGKIEPVDIITGGSPCQDLSLAGKRAGLIEGSRSNLFFEYMRIVKEMRDATDGKYPRFIVWENVCGAFSSNKGEDFKAVLDTIIKIKNTEAPDVPMPADGKWPYADIFLGDGWSIAYRTFDAQYWGVPQRRRRIYLVADFGGQSAGKILFESEGLQGNTPQGCRPWEEVAGGIAACLGESGGVLCLNDQGGQRMDVTEGKIATLRAESNHPPLVFENHGNDARCSGPLKVAPTVVSRYGTGGNNLPLVTDKCYDVRFTSDGTRNARGNCYETETSRTLDIGGNKPDSNQGGVAVAFGISSFESNGMKSDNPESGIYRTDTARTLDVCGGNPGCNQGGIAVVEGNGCRPSHKGDGYSGSGIMYTLNTVENHAVAYGMDRASFNQGAGGKFDFSVEMELEPPILASGPGAVAVPSYAMSTGNFMQVEREKSPTLAARDYKDPSVVNSRYIVRRLTPRECARLQGFPDWWCDNLGSENPSDEDIEWWRNVFIEYNLALGKSVRPKTDKQIRKWLFNPNTDAAEYKLWGNGVALPCVYHVMKGIAHYGAE